MVTWARDFMAGCFDRMRAPIPMNIMIAELTTLFLYVERRFFPYAYSYTRPSVMKMV